MGANTLYFVKVLRLKEDEVEVSALTDVDAMEQAARMPGVAKAVSAKSCWFDEEEDA